MVKREGEKVEISFSRTSPPIIKYWIKSSDDAIAVARPSAHKNLPIKSFVLNDHSA